MAPPTRIQWAVDQLGLASSDQVLEVGCGDGTALHLISQRLTTGHIVAIDRSATAIKRAAARNTDHIAAGTATLLQADLAGLDLGRDFDTIFAVNVNLFWVTPAEAELRVIRDHLRPDGTLHLFYEPPAPDRVVTLGEAVQATLVAQRFSAAMTVAPSGIVCAIQARLGPPR